MTITRSYQFKREVRCYHH